MPSRARALIFASHFRTPDLSYYWDWFETLRSHPRLEADVVSTLGKTRLALELLRRRRESYDAIFFPYGFFYNNQDRWSRAAFQALGDVRGTRVYFLENEYRSINRKLACALSLSADYVTTQLPKDVADRLYAPFVLPERIVALPHGLNEKAAEALFARFGRGAREIDLDFTGDPYPFYLGQNDREEMSRFFASNAEKYGLRVSFDIGREKRLPREAWIERLCRAKGVLHQESGSDFLETNDSTAKKIGEYMKTRPRATFAEVYDAFFRDYPKPVSGRCISSRHFDAIGARTCQVMFPGRYNDILRPDEHYLALRRDFGDVEDVLRRLRDDAHRLALVDRTYEYARGAHTLTHRVDHLLRAIGLG
jgi:hypothetical protein